MIQKFALIIITVLTGISLNAQSYSKKIYHPFTGTIVFTAEGGATYIKSDFTTSMYDYTGRAALEYFFPFYAKSSFGIRAIGGTGYFRGKRKPNVTPPLVSDEFKTSFNYAGGSVIYAFSIGEWLFPYISAGASYVWFDPQNEFGNPPSGRAIDYKKSELQFNTEAGWRIKLSDFFTFNFGVMSHISRRDYLDDIFLNNNYDMGFSGFAGFSVAFFALHDEDEDGIDDNRDRCPDTPEGVRVDDAGCPLDLDNDGVPDYLDLCANTPPNVKVDRNGCPIDSDHDGVPDYLDLCPSTPLNITVDESGCPKDSDGDGIPDYLDKCPNTPKGAAVDQLGCPIDSDGDGVADYADLCPNTPKGTQVDEHGCPLEKEQVIKEVPVVKEVIKEVPVVKEVVKEVPVEKQVTLSAGTSFAVGKAILQPAALVVLDSMILKIKAEPNSLWRIEGYTDNVGALEANKKLSLDRANAVLKYFISKGLPGKQFSVRGLGPDFPVGDNNTDAGRAMNRRVVIIRIN